jgi:hypothetical protein
VITPAIFFNIPSTPSAFSRTFLRELRNCFDRRFFLYLLIPLFFVALPIIILSARLSLVPCILVHDADFEAARDTPENIFINAAFVDLAGSAARAAAPLEVCVVVEGFAGGESIESITASEWRL